MKHGAGANVPFVRGGVSSFIPPPGPWYDPKGSEVTHWSGSKDCGGRTLTS